ncbi:hypothetical protein B0I35DRAFT_481194 [Stachybotrys elegans]|uniref:Uncharacterized protein n=1 Tax=Stachybotrys elegans TaxID=80388 RepID=A0A8K0WPG0_9HYPO|nr:hypothetical protein B0I35DRAFT_481194 [Stachybotrys elegans]
MLLISTHQERVATKAALLQPPPSTDKAVDRHSSGFDCLVIVARRACAEMLSTPNCYLRLRDYDDSLGLLSYAMRDLSQDKKDDKAGYFAAKVAMMDRFGPDAKFAHLIERVQDQENPLFAAAFRRPLDLHGAVREWNGNEAKTAVIEWSRGTLQEAVDAAFEWRDVDGRREIWRSSKPKFMQVLYRSDEKHPLQLHQVRHFSVTTEAPAPFEAHTCWYHLIAMVRMGEGGKEPDKVRTFCTAGRTVSLARRGIVCTSPNWSVSDAIARQYYMVFVLHGDSLAPSDSDKPFKCTEHCDLVDEFDEEMGRT